MNKKADLKKISEAYQAVKLNELNLGPGAETTNTVPSNNVATVVSLPDNEECEGLHGETDVTETESHMAKSEIYKVHKIAKELYNLIKDESELEPWIFSKITIAADYLEGVRNYLEYNKFKAEGEFNASHEDHEFRIVSRIRDMLKGENKSVVESVLRDVIFTIEAKQTTEIKQQ